MSFDALLEAIKKAQAQASGTSPQPVSVTKPKRHERRERKERARRTIDIDALKDALKDIIQEAVREAYLKGFEEGLKKAREPTEENLVRTVWNSEPSGVKLSNLCLVFGRERSNEIQGLLLELERRGVLVRDRNRWWHINPRFAERILEHYGIEYSQEELRAIRTRLRNRILGWDSLPDPTLE